MVLVFDVNETLLDLGVLRPHFERMFGDGRVLGEWFGLLLRQSLVATVTEKYRPFDVLARGALGMMARKYGVELAAEEVVAMVGMMSQLPAHPDVVPALTQLQSAGYRMAALTNNPPHVLAAQLANAKLESFFERQLTVDAVKRFKPAAEVYRYAAAQLGIPISEMMMVAAHDWDVLGAIRAGAKGAFVARPSAMWEEAAERPDIFVPDIIAMANTLVERSGEWYN